ncbi:MAG: S9 family peptidase, partial [Anaerolineae bacterium]
GQWVAFVRAGRKMTDDLPVLTIMTPECDDLRELSREFDRSLDGFDWAADSSRLYLIMGSDGNTELYAVSPEGGPVEKVVEGRFQAYDLKAGPNGVAYVATTPFTSTDLYWFDSDTGETRQLTDVNAGFFDEVLVQETHEIRFEGPGGQEIQGWYILPGGYEEGQQYPLALNIHGGPHVMWGPSEKTMFHEWQIHAASGYVVFYCNPRGSMGYGQAFNNAIHGTWGEVAMPDVMAGVDQMIDMGLVDPARMADTGGSYGGYLPGWIIGHTDRFAAAVPQRGVYNIASFYGTSDVPLLMSAEFDGEPWEEEAYQRMWHYSPLAHAHKVTTPTLIIHAENDFRVPIEQSEQFFAFIRRATDTPVELWRFPREGHELSRSGAPRLRVGRLEKMIGWFDQYCKG